MQNLLLGYCCLVAGGLLAQCPTLIWSDEFDGTSLDETNWSYQLEDGCNIGLCNWGNNEAQWYTKENLEVTNGVLKIHARREQIGGKGYTSARINSKNKRDFKYGYFEARMKLSPGQGLWPAFWMLPTDEVYGGWPQSGEIDIMEWAGNRPDRLYGTLHYGQPFPNNSFTGVELFLQNKAWSDEFHTFAVEWVENKITWFVDGYPYGTLRPGNLSPERWPFDQEFHFLLNLALGGTFGGPINANAVPASMEVDYVRVYDTALPRLNGPRELAAGATNVSYTVADVPEGASISWAVPTGAVITDNSSPLGILVDFPEGGGEVIATITSDCGEVVLSTDVYVAPFLVSEYSFENFDATALAIYEFSTGELTETDNPAPNSVNGSALSGQYVRDRDNPFDVIVYGVNSIEEADDYVTEIREFSLDLYTQAKIGTQVLLQLETAAAQPNNYPTGRHSRYTATTQKQGEWHRLSFRLLDEPDRGASSRSIQKLVLLFDPDSSNGDTYYYDNLDSYAAPPVSIFQSPVLDFPLSLSPNPTQEKTTINFTLDTPQPVTISVLDASGKTVQQLPVYPAVVGEQSIQLELSNLSAGLYFVRLSLPNGSNSRRLIIR
ncbi:MAG: family 16 glycosylhydrolase [Bacteroidota bacterium]